jgi:hypothetical protein
MASFLIYRNNRLYDEAPNAAIAFQWARSYQRDYGGKFEVKDRDGKLLFAVSQIVPFAQFLFNDEVVSMNKQQFEQAVKEGKLCRCQSCLACRAKEYFEETNPTKLPWERKDEVAERTV